MPILALPPAGARLGLARLDASRLAYTRSWWKAPTISRLAIKRMGGKRMGYANPVFRTSIDGVWRNASNVRIDGLGIQDELDGTPNTATARVQSFVPQAGMEVAFYLGDTAPWHRVFRGRILTCVQVYDLLPAHLCYDISCISGEWRLNQYKVTERYLSMSATAIVLDLCATYVPWVDTSGVETGLEYACRDHLHERGPDDVSRPAEGPARDWRALGARLRRRAALRHDDRAGRERDSPDHGWQLSRAHRDCRVDGSQPGADARAGRRRRLCGGHRARAGRDAAAGGGPGLV